MTAWRLLDTGARSAAENMALDDALLKARSGGAVPNTLRFLQFSPPAVLVGYHQVVEQEIRGNYCRDRGIDINRRLTGGGTIYFDRSQLGWELIASKEDFGLGRVLFPFFEKICGALIAALAELGIHAQYRFKNDIEVGGRKISGTGGVEEADAFLFQGTLLMDFDVESMLYALRVPTEKLKAKEISSARDRVTCLKNELGWLPSLDDVKAAIARGFSRTFGAELETGGLHPLEEQLFREHLDYYTSEDWVYAQAAPSGGQLTLRSARNTPGGLVRTAVSYDPEKERLNSVLITGDFFAFPARTIYDLEVYLKGTSRDMIGERIRKFFKTADCQVPGVSPDQFAAAIDQTLIKADYMGMGLLPHEADSVFTINTKLDEIARINTLLIPYCSKPTDCEFRNEKTCGLCGECGVGELYATAQRHGVEPVSIVNFEDLMATLRKLENRKAGPYLGSCCEAFFIKHEEDFRSIDLPGVLVDIDSSTCYDLGLEREAKRGTFENQTRLKTELIAKLLQLNGGSRAESSWVQRAT